MQALSPVMIVLRCQAICQIGNAYTVVDILLCYLESLLLVAVQYATWSSKKWDS